ncbi:hypothetical protein [Enterocloster citroniae]|uniref:Uncharacterized protein n=1 Tax=[Clostridium] citroniae WAL-17108 TaxID=742733 RepID=G5HES3_9FIRM|nr:hypothetical protein [Enterocloster citroniae]EHF00032.1 hypothetical protein HMPREF9469_00946 [ [[Clostridium] citroniae WAL-17108]MCC3383291.1 hypothetical protein [Enterocloster citroniae]DAT42498.1 MAG TPA: capsid protein [Caudoviricetes sp.]
MRLDFNYDACADNIKAVFSAPDYIEFSKLCSDTVKGAVVKYSTEDANRIILKNVRKVMGISNNPTIREVKKSLKKTANREAMFELVAETIEDTIITGWQDQPFFVKYVEYRTMALGQSNRFSVPENTDFIVSEISASNHMITRQRPGKGKEFTVSVKSYGAKFYCEAEAYLMGLEDWSALIEKIAKAYTKRINTLIYSAIKSAGKMLPNPDQWNIASQMQKADRKNFDKLCQDVAMATGKQPIIIGTAVGLARLTDMADVDWAPESAKSDVYSLGRLGKWTKYDIIEIPNAFEDNDTSKYLVDDDILYIMPDSGQFIKWYDEGDTEIYEITDRATHMDHTYDYEISRKFGLGIVTAGTRFGTVKIAD